MILLLLGLDLDIFTALIASDVAVGVQSHMHRQILHFSSMISNAGTSGAIFASGGNLFHWGIVCG